jgi:hypothetical protein
VAVQLSSLTPVRFSNSLGTAAHEEQYGPIIAMLKDLEANSSSKSKIPFVYFFCDGVRVVMVAHSDWVQH